jgi:uncharacterized membrane protein YoaK (UPF0700 family)
VPVFIAVLGVVLLACGRAGKAGHGSRRTLLALHAALLVGYLGLGVGFGPFPDADRALAVFVGMLGVAAMATQNALVRLALTGAPSSAVMTTNITQLAIDLAALAGGRGNPDDLARDRRQVGVTSLCVVGFVAGCAAGAALECLCGLWALALPVILAVLAVPLGEVWVTAGPSKQVTAAHPSLFHAAESVGESALEHLPRFLLYNPLNPWGLHPHTASPASESDVWPRARQMTH